MYRHANGFNQERKTATSQNKVVEFGPEIKNHCWLERECLENPIKLSEYISSGDTQPFSAPMADLNLGGNFGESGGRNPQPQKCMYTMCIMYTGL